MFRRFDFETELTDDLELIPITVRRKLDASGVKLHLEEWRRLTLAERRALCHLPIATNQETSVFAAILTEMVFRACGRPPESIAPSRAVADPAPAPIPAKVIELLGKHRLDPTAWEKFDFDERYALIKLARDDSKFLAGWREITAGLSEKRKPG